MKDEKYFRSSRKNPGFRRGGGGGGGSRKANIWGDYLKRGDLDSLRIWERGGVGKKEEGGVLEGRLMPQCALCMPTQINFDQLLILWICINKQKISLFYLSIFQILSVLKSHHMTGHTHFWPCQPLKLSN